jgi:hypothetical protein
MQEGRCWDRHSSEAAPAAAATARPSAVVAAAQTQLRGGLMPSRALV